MARSRLQDLVDGVAVGGTLALEPRNREWQGPVVIGKAMMIEGQGGTIWSPKGPVVSIEAGGVVLKDVFVAVTGREERLVGEGGCALAIERGVEVELHDVVVQGTVVGLAEEEGEWRYPRSIRLGVLRAGVEHEFRVRLVVPVPCGVRSEVEGVVVRPGRVKVGGPVELVVGVEAMQAGTMLRFQDVVLRTAFLERRIRVSGSVSDEGRVGRGEVVWEPDDWEELKKRARPAKLTKAVVIEPPAVKQPVGVPKVVQAQHQAEQADEVERPLPVVETPETGGAVATEARREAATVAAPAAGYRPGSTVGGRFALKEKLGGGGMGVVFGGFDLLLEEEVALKFLPPALAQDPSSVEQLARDVKHARRVAGKNVLRVYDLLDDGLGGRFVTMEWAKGGHLGAFMKQRGRLAWGEAKRILTPLLHGLRAIHDAGIVHRDLTPRNILFRDDGTLVVADFGISRSIHSSMSRLSQDTSTSGTPPYVAPETIEGGTPSPATDLYSVGCIAYELMAGRPPFSAEDAVQMAVLYQHLHRDPSFDEIPSSAVRWVGACLVKDRGRRVQDVAALLKGLSDPTALPEYVPVGGVSGRRREGVRR